LVVLTIAASLWPAVATADPYRPAILQTLAAAPGSVTASDGAIVATLEPRAFAVPVDAPYSYRATVRLDGDADIVQMRFKVLNPSGRLMIQRTIIQSDVTTGQAQATFERELSDLNLAPGAYPVELNVRVAQGAKIAETTLQTELLLYEPDGAKVPVVIAVRIGGQPLADPSGRFVADPARYTRARDDARAIAQWVLDDPEAKLTVALSPLLLEEWKRISAGYVLTGPEGETSVEASEAVPAAYAAALGTIGRAVDTGRFELAHLGYSDPNLADLSLQGLIRDVRPQYSYGRSALFTSLETTPSTGTVVAGGCVPPESVTSLAAEGVSYAIVSASCARSGQTTPTSGAYRVRNSPLTVLVTQGSAERALAQGDADAVARITLRRRLAGSASPVVMRATVDPGGLSVSELRSAVDSLMSQDWVRAETGQGAAARTPRRTVALRTDRGSTRAPAEYWDDVKTGRDWAGALSAGYGATRPATVQAQRDSLIAQCSAWAGPSGNWASADRGRSFADNATRLGRSVYDGVTLAVKSVTLAGTSGEVPVIITNESGSALSLKMVLTPSRAVKVGSERRSTVEVLPKDNFFEIPVSLQDALSGELVVRVSAGDVVLESEAVTIRASYLDRLVMILGVIFILGALLAFIIRRVRAAESEGTNTPGDEAYPGDELDGG